MPTRNHLIFALLSLTACGDGDNDKRQPQTTASAEEAKLWAQERAIANERAAATAELVKACNDGRSLALEFTRKVDEGRAIVRTENEPSIEKARLAYERTIGNPIYDMTGVGVGEAIDLKNDYGNVRVASLRQEQSVLEAFLPLSTMAEEDAQHRRVANAAGRSTSIDCAASQALLNRTLQATDNLRKIEPVASWASQEKAVLQAAASRIREQRALVDHLMPNKR